jgi:hypothetical protein
MHTHTACTRLSGSLSHRYSSGRISLPCTTLACARAASPLLLPSLLLLLLTPHCAAPSDRSLSWPPSGSAASAEDDPGCAGFGVYERGGGCMAFLVGPLSFYSVLTTVPLDLSYFWLGIEDTLFHASASPPTRRLKNTGLNKTIEIMIQLREDSPIITQFVISFNTTVQVIVWHLLP